MNRLKLTFIFAVVAIGSFARPADAATNRIFAGNSHTCAITSGGALKCWGYNGNGQLGNGTTTTTATPQQVVGMTSGVTYVAAGAFNTCAIKNGQPFCWGDNSYGQLGSGETPAQKPYSSVPVAVYTSQFSSTTTKITVGTYHSCAQIDYSYPSANGGEAYCWGRNTDGQLGNGSGVDSYVPVPPVGSGNGVTYHLRELSAADNYTCAIGDVLWPADPSQGQGTYCWGNNNFNQVWPGLGNRTTPWQQDALWVRNVRHITTAYKYACASDFYGNTVCWGSANYMNGPATAPALSQPISANPYKSCGKNSRCTNWPLSGVNGSTWLNDVKTSGFYTAARDGYQMILFGLIYGGGWQEFCRLGNGNCTATNVNTFSPDSITKLNSNTFLSGVSELSVGTWHSCAMAPDQTAPFAQRPYCWGYNFHGQAGNGAPGSPLQVQFATAIPGVW